METAIDYAQSTSTSPAGHNLLEVLNVKHDRNRKCLYATLPKRIGVKRKNIDPFSIPDFLDDTSKFGSAGKDIEVLRAQRMKITNVKSIPSKDASYLVDQKDCSLSDDDLIVLGDNSSSKGVPAAENIVILSDSDEEDQRDSYVNQETVLEKPADQLNVDEVIFKDTDLLVNKSLRDEENLRVISRTSDNEVKQETCVNVMNCAETEPLMVHATDCDEISATSVGSIPDEMQLQKDEDIDVTTDSKDLKDSETELKKDKGVYVGVEDDTSDDSCPSSYGDDGLKDEWAEMDIALESVKEVGVDQSSDQSIEEDCGHSFVIKDDTGLVCVVCGLVKRGIEEIFEFQYKVKRSSRTYVSTSLSNTDRELTGISLDKLDTLEHESNLTELYAHPRHRNQMKAHQVEGFNFLVNNLMRQDPGGCILAHAPGSGKTFMMICFTQIFLVKYPQERVLVVLPKGILPTWKKEFETWRVEDIPLHDFYSVKAENRSQQLEVLKKWVEQKSILFLGYKQFSTIVCDTGTKRVVAACRDILLKVPEVLILDEGHTSRNEETEVFDSLAKIRTLRRVVLSGTLYQNHVKEVFNILNLVRPQFLRLKSSLAIVKRIMSRAQIASGKHVKSDANSTFFDVVENTLHKDENLRRRECVIQDLREMTSKVLHYYKGDFLDELPGLLDFTVLLNLSEKQKPEVKKLKKLDNNFKRISVGSLIYVHQQLKYFSEKNPIIGKKFSFDSDEKMDEMLTKIDVKDGVKANFFLKLLRLCESTGEKLLVFSQFLLPLKFFERLAVNVKGWSLNKELFMISGDSNSEHREWSMDRFNSSTDARVFFGSIKACGEGISLVGASRILILDVHVNPSVTRQALGRAFRPGQKKKVYVYRLVAADSPEEEDHLTCFKKELISKMWFEYNESLTNQDFKIKTVDVNDCGDSFLESSLFQDDIKVLYRR